MEIPEVKSLRWLANMFPLQIPARDDNDRLCNAIHLYCTAGADKIEAQELRIQELDAELMEAHNSVDNVQEEFQLIKNGWYNMADKIKNEIDRIFDGVFEMEEAE